MATDIVCRCQSCGGTFAFRPRKSNKYCGMECYRVAQRAGAYKRGHGPDFPRHSCAHCGSEVARNLSTCRNGDKSDKAFCNRGCYDAYRAAIRKEREMGCPCCGKAFIPDSRDQKYCSDACWKLDKKAEPRNCVNCGCYFTPMKWHPEAGRLISTNSGKTCSAECHIGWIRNNEERKAKISAAFTGEKHPQWRGGKSLHSTTGSRGPNWQKQRKAALKRDGYACVDCGLTSEQSKAKYDCDLHVDHVVPYHNFRSYKEANRLSNLQCRCASCHTKIERTRTMVQMTLPLRDSARSGHRPRPRGERINTARLTAAQVMEIRKRADDGAVLADLAREFGVNTTNVCDVVHGKVWKHLPLGVSAGKRRKPKPRAPKGEQSPFARFTAERVTRFRERAAAGEALSAIASSEGESYYQIHQLVRGKCWAHLPVLPYKTKNGWVHPKD